MALVGEVSVGVVAFAVARHDRPPPGPAAWLRWVGPTWKHFVFTHTGCLLSLSGHETRAIKVDGSNFV